MSYPTIKLGDIITFNTGFAFKSKDYKNSGIKVFRVTNIGKNHLPNSKDFKYISKDFFDEKFKKYELFENDVILVMVGATTGKLGIITNDILPAVLNQNMWKLEVKNNNILDKRFLFLSLYFNMPDFLGVMQGAAREFIKQKDFKEKQISLPPLPTQKLIVQKLDSAFKNIDESINITKKNIENIEELNKSSLENIFLNNDFNNVKLEKIVDFKNGYAFKSKDFNENNNGLQVIRIGNVLKLNKNPVYINEDEKYNSFKLLKNDLIIGLTGTRQKRDYLFPGIIQEPKYYLNQRVGRIRTKDDLNFKYVYFYLKTNLFRDKIFKFETGTVNQGNISGKDLINQKIPLPNLEKQKEIVSYLDEVFEKNKVIKEGYEKKLKELEEMKQSILKEAFENEEFVK